MAAPAAAPINVKREGAEESLARSSESHDEDMTAEAAGETTMDKIVQISEAWQRVMEVYLEGPVEALGEALRKVDELKLAELMKELHAEQQYRAGQELAAQKLAKAQERLQEAVVSQADDTIDDACVGLENAIAQCETAGMQDELKVQRSVLADARSAVERRATARLKLDTASGAALGEKGRRQSLQKAVDEGREAGLQDNDLKTARHDLEQEAALAILRRLVSHHMEYEFNDDASMAELREAIYAIAELPEKAPKDFQNATRVLFRMAARRRARKGAAPQVGRPAAASQTPSRRQDPGAADGAPLPRGPRPAPDAQPRKRPRSDRGPVAAEAAPPHTPRQPGEVADAANGARRPQRTARQAPMAEDVVQPRRRATGEAAAAADGEPLRRNRPGNQRSDQSSSEGGQSSGGAVLPSGCIFWKRIGGDEDRRLALVINADTFPKELTTYGINAGMNATKDFKKEIWNDMRYWVDCSEAAGRGYMFWDAHIAGGRTVRACSYGEPQKDRTMRALGVALAIACAERHGQHKKYREGIFSAGQFKQLVSAATAASRPAGRANLRSRPGGNSK